MYSKEEVKAIIESYVKTSIGEHCIVNPSVFEKTYEDFVKEYQEKGEIDEPVTFLQDVYYENLLDLCEHEEYEILTDEDDDGREYRYGWCPYCDRSAIIEESESEDGKEQTFDWQ